MARHSDQATKQHCETRYIWDLFTRIFHWTLVVAVVSGWGLGRFGPSVLSLHYYIGYSVGALIVWRIYWGFVGPKPARFRSFLYGPKAIIVYLTRLGRRRPSHWPGHTPAGAMFVFAILIALAVQVATGLIADPDDYVNAGSLAGMVEFDTARWAAGLHRGVSKVILFLVVGHLLAVVFYRIWKRENLVDAMVTGFKQVRKDDPNA